MQFKVPQNIDLEDKIVGPLTMIQFIYLLAGGLIDYMLFSWLGAYHMGIFLLLGIPIGLFALALAFLKIQDQPLSHFITAGLYYLSHPKTRLWRQEGVSQQIVVNAPKPKKEEAPHIIKRKAEKSELEKLATVLDTSPQTTQEKESFGKITKGFEKLLQKEPQK